jgi:monoamine oxidase
VIKVQVVYSKPWWRERGLSGSVWSPDELISITFDGTPPEGEPGVIMGLIEGARAVEAGGWTSARRQEAVIDFLRRAYGSEAANAVAYLDRDWSAEAWTRGCYGGHMPPGVWSQFGPTLRQPIGRIHFAGTETAEEWMGYVDGAVESGERAATELLEHEAGAVPPDRALTSGRRLRSGLRLRPTR